MPKQKSLSPVAKPAKAPNKAQISAQDQGNALSPATMPAQAPVQRGILSKAIDLLKSAPAARPVSED